MTVAATTSADRRAAFSDYGRCVDIFAPGTAILSADAAGDDAATTLSGTSMAAPYAAGVVAGYLSHAPSARPRAVRLALLAHATHDALHRLGPGSPNVLLRAVRPQRAPTP